VQYRVFGLIFCRKLKTQPDVRRTHLPECNIIFDHRIGIRHALTCMTDSETQQDAKIFRYPDRFVDRRGVETWNNIMLMLDEIETESTVEAPG
jgi:hypothetical protein